MRAARLRQERDVWQQRADQKQRESAEGVLRAAEDDAAKQTLPALKELAQANVELAKIWTGSDGLNGRLRSASRQLVTTKTNRAKVERQRTNASSRVTLAEQIGLTTNESMGQLLRRERGELQDLRDLRIALEGEFQRVTEAQIHILENDEAKRKILNVDAELKSLLESVGELTDTERAAVEAEGRRLFESQRDLRTALSEG